MGEKMDPVMHFEMPGVGLFVSFTDTEGNVATLYQDLTIKRL